MLPLEALEKTEANALEGLLFDLDDTLLDHGSLGENAYRALFRLRESGLRLVALTGRPLSFADFIARTWPVAGAIAENGAVGVVIENERVALIDGVSTEVREERKARLETLRRTLRKELPTLVVTDDAHLRHTDLTFDIGEHESAPEDLIERAIAFGHEHGARTARSSIHLHFSFDHADKATGALAFLRRTTKIDETLARKRYAFVGDSDNDAPAFAAFSTTIGVANVRLRSGLFPRYRTSLARGAGFVEFAERLITLRKP